MKRSIQCRWVYALALVSSLLVSCASPPKPPKAIKTVAFITNSTSDFWKVARKGCEKADAELPDVTVAFKTTNTGTIEEQNGLIRQALDRDEADAIAISPVDPAGQKKVINDASKRAFVMTQDSDAPDTDRALYLGADNRAAGRQAGELIKQALPQGGKIMAFVGKREVQNAQERFQGLKESLQGSNIVIIELMTDDANPSTARDNAYETVKKYPDIAGMVGLWSYNGPAIVQALRQESKLGKVKIVCFDDERETLAAIREGVVFGTVAQQPFDYGYQAVKTAAQVLKGDRSVIPANKIIFVPTVVIQRNNVDEYSKKLDQLLAK
jgi:ribose transport system substrate-binding protein